MQSASAHQLGRSLCCPRSYVSHPLHPSLLALIPNRFQAFRTKILFPFSFLPISEFRTAGGSEVGRKLYREFSRSGIRIRRQGIETLASFISSRYSALRQCISRVGHDWDCPQRARIRFCPPSVPSWRRTVLPGSL